MVRNGTFVQNDEPASKRVDALCECHNKHKNDVVEKGLGQHLEQFEKGRHRPSECFKPTKVQRWQKTIRDIWQLKLANLVMLRLA